MAEKTELEEGDPGGHGPRTCRSAVQEENVDSGKRNFEAGNTCLCSSIEFPTRQYLCPEMRIFNLPFFMRCTVKSQAVHSVCTSVCQGVSAKTRFAFRAN